MKLSRTAWLILGIGIFVIAFGGLCLVYFQQGNEREQLNDSLLVAQATLPKVVSEKEDWERQLAQWESQLAQLESELAQAKLLLAESKTSFPKAVESIEYDEEIFKIADDCDLELTKLTSLEPADINVEPADENVEPGDENVEPGDKNVESITYSVTSFVVDVNGEVANMLDFINTIATSKAFTTATVELVDIEVPQPLSEEEKAGLTEEAIEDREKPSATVSLAIYAYKGE